MDQATFDAIAASAPLLDDATVLRLITTLAESRDNVGRGGVDAWTFKISDDERYLVTIAEDDPGYY